MRILKSISRSQNVLCQLATRSSPRIPTWNGVYNNKDTFRGVINHQKSMKFEHREERILNLIIIGKELRILEESTSKSAVVTSKHNGSYLGMIGICIDCSFRPSSPYHTRLKLGRNKGIESGTRNLK